MSGVIAYCRMTDSAVYKNGKKVFEKNADSQLVAAVYSWLGIDYPKIHKMDLLSSLGFLASEVILRDLPKQEAASTAVVLSNVSSSLDTDRRYWEASKKNPSPALFVYTLPNIVAGEICIRNGFKGESIFFVANSFQAASVPQYVEMLFAANEAQTCLAGWVEANAGQVDVFLYLAGKSATEPLAPHTPASILDLYMYGKSNA